MRSDRNTGAIVSSTRGLLQQTKRAERDYPIAAEAQTWGLGYDRVLKRRGAMHGRVRMADDLENARRWMDVGAVRRGVAGGYPLGGYGSFP